MLARFKCIYIAIYMYIYQFRITNIQKLCIYLIAYVAVVVVVVIVVVVIVIFLQ